MGKPRVIKRALRSLGLALGAAVLSPLGSSAVLVSPHALFIDHQTRTAQFTVANSSDEPEEVDIEFMFGYPQTDSLGNPFIRLFEEPGADSPSAAQWIRAFPPRIRLEPGQRQVVRLLANPPQDLADREYWSRIIVTSRKARPLMTEAGSSVRAGLTLELRTIIALLYRKGTVRTGIALNDLRTTVEGDSLAVWVDLEREGNAAYLGSLRFTVDDADGRTVRTWKTAVAVYNVLNRRLTLPLDGLARGQYRVRLEISTARDDIPQAEVLPAPSIVRSFDIHVG